MLRELNRSVFMMMDYSCGISNLSLIPDPQLVGNAIKCGGRLQAVGVHARAPIDLALALGEAHLPPFFGLEYPSEAQSTGQHSCRWSLVIASSMAGHACVTVKI